MTWKLDIVAPVNGRIRRADVTALDDANTVLTTGRADLYDAKERKKLAEDLAQDIPGASPEDVEKKLKEGWRKTLGEHRAEQAAREAGAAVGNDFDADILDNSPETIRRPLCLVGGCATRRPGFM